MISLTKCASPDRWRRYTWAFTRAEARFAVPEDASYIYGFLNDYGRTFVIAETNFVDAGIGRKVPRELRYMGLTLAPDAQTAHPILYNTVDNTHRICQLSANAGASNVRETLFTEIPTQARNRFFQKAPFGLYFLPRSARFLDQVSTINLAGAIWDNTDRQRLMVALSHYCEALRVWRPNAAPMVMLHLYIAAEALTELALRGELARRNVSEIQLMSEYAISPEEYGAKSKLRGAVRRDVIFQGDAETYRKATDLSNGIEHGYASFQNIWAVPFECHKKTARYVREAILDLSGVADEHRTVLKNPRFTDPFENTEPPITRGRYGPLQRVDFREESYDPDIRSLKVDEAQGTFEVRFRDQHN